MEQRRSGTGANYQPRIRTPLSEEPESAAHRDFTPTLAAEKLRERRTVRDDETLTLVFTWHEDREFSKEPTLHYRCGVYLIEPSPETREIRDQAARIAPVALRPSTLRDPGNHGPAPFSRTSER